MDQAEAIAQGVDLHGLLARIDHVAETDPSGLRRLAITLAHEVVRARRMLLEERDAAPAAVGRNDNREGAS